MASDEEAQPRKPSQRRRRPRKLKRQESEPVQTVAAPEIHLERRVETLDSRIKKVESQIEVIRARSTEPNAKEKSRNRRRKPVSPPVEPTPGEQPPKNEALRRTNVDHKDEHESADEVEEIVRTADPPDHQDHRAPISVIGSYRLPLPRSVSEQDVLAITKGLSSVTNIARKVMADANATSADGSHSSTMRSSDSGSLLTRDEGYSRTQSGLGWSSWFGSYSASVSRVINNIEVEASVEQNDRPAQRHMVVRRAIESPASPQRKPRKLKLKSSTAMHPPAQLEPTASEGVSN